jgi:hypothetical protein
MNQRDGSFAGYQLSLQGIIYAIAIADFDGDGRPDIAVCGTPDLGLAVFFDDGAVVADAGGAPEFFAPVSLAGSPCFQMIATRFTSGGPAGLAFIGDSEDSNAVQVMLGVGDGGFLPWSVNPVTGPSWIRAADFNNDGLLDLAVSDVSGISVLMNLDGGVFGAATSTPALPDESGGVFTVSDVNGDGYPDIIEADEVYDCALNAPDVLVFLNDCRGGFTSGAVLDAGATGGANAVTTLRSPGNSLPSIVAAEHCSGNLTVFPNLSQ